MSEYEYTNTDAAALLVKAIEQLRLAFVEFYKDTDPPTGIPELKKTYETKAIEGATYRIRFDSTGWIYFEVEKSENGSRGQIAIREPDMGHVVKILLSLFRENGIYATPKVFSDLIDWVEEYCAYINEMREYRKSEARKILEGQREHIEKIEAHKVMTQWSSHN